MLYVCNPAVKHNTLTIRVLKAYMQKVAFQTAKDL